jgi:hypothetical protein
MTIDIRSPLGINVKTVPGKVTFDLLLKARPNDSTARIVFEILDDSNCVRFSNAQKRTSTSSPVSAGGTRVIYEDHFQGGAGTLATTFVVRARVEENGVFQDDADNQASVTKCDCAGEGTVKFTHLALNDGDAVLEMDPHDPSASTPSDEAGRAKRKKSKTDRG